MRILWMMAGLLVLAGCAPSATVQQPMTARPEMALPVTYSDGAIYHVNGSARPLFEDRRARNVGDILTINIIEATSATNNSASSGSHTGTLAATTPSLTLGGAAAPMLKPLTLAGSSGSSSANKFANSGASNFTGSITVTVIEVLPNGNLVVSGEKQMAIDQSNDYIRLSGVVNPADITNGVDSTGQITNNVVQSTKVADARIEYKGRKAVLDSATMMDIMGRLFLSVLPF